MHSLRSAKLRRMALGAICLAASIRDGRSLESFTLANPPVADEKSRAQAKATFATICASCHGLDARGAERGPDLVSRPEVVRKSDAALQKILQDGVPAAGMPSFRSYGSARLSALVAYVRELQGTIKDAVLPGKPAEGKALFFGKAKCAQCHQVRGQGGFFGPDLTAFAAGMSAEAMQTAIVRFNDGLDPRRGLLTVTLTDATKLTGVARNEDNFSLQLQTEDGTFHLLNKSDIRAETYLGRSAMPADSLRTLSSSEWNDLVSFLMETARLATTPKPKANFDDDE
jgi:cytochrome c oxidase cbb3-type subunit III